MGAVPGPVTSVNSIGPHELVRAGTARLVTSAVDIESLVSRSGGGRTELGPEFQPREAPAQNPAARNL